MAYLLLFLIPVGAVLAWAGRRDWKRRRREITGHDISTALESAKGKATEWGAGGGSQ